MRRPEIQTAVVIGFRQHWAAAAPVRPTAVCGVPVTTGQTARAQRGSDGANDAPSSPNRFNKAFSPPCTRSATAALLQGGNVVCMSAPVVHTSVPGAHRRRRRHVVTCTDPRGVRRRLAVWREFNPGAAIAPRSAPRRRTAGLSGARCLAHMLNSRPRPRRAVHTLQERPNPRPAAAPSRCGPKWADRRSARACCQWRCISPASANHSTRVGGGTLASWSAGPKRDCMNVS